MPNLGSASLHKPKLGDENAGDGLGRDLGLEVKVGETVGSIPTSGFFPNGSSDIRFVDGNTEEEDEAIDEAADIVLRRSTNTSGGGDGRGGSKSARIKDSRANEYAEWVRWLEGPE